MPPKQIQEALPSPTPGEFAIDVDQTRERASEPVLQRLRQIEGLKGYWDCFHRAVPNNYVLMMINLSYPLQNYLTSLAEYTSPLNQANARVYEYCLEKLKDLPRNEVLKNDGIIQLMGGWKRTITTSANLGGVTFSERVFAALAELGIDARSRWQTEAPEIREMFTGVPHKVERLLRINLSIPHDLIISALGQLMNDMLRLPELLSLIERIEVAKPHVNSDSSVKNYPTIIFYLVDDANEGGRYEEVDQLLQHLQPFFAGFEGGLEAEPDFADLWYPFVTVTQGHRLWKRYLRVLGLLDEVYDRDFNYAYLKPEPGRAQWNFPQILSRHRRPWP